MSLGYNYWIRILTQIDIVWEITMTGRVLPESTGWTLFYSIETANNGDKFATVLATSSLSVNM